MKLKVVKKYATLTKQFRYIFLDFMNMKFSEHIILSDFEGILIFRNVRNKEQSKKIGYIKRNNDLEKFIKIKGVGGFTDPINGDIVCLSSDLPEFHEIIHYITLSWEGWPNQFISEGITESFRKPIYFDDFVNNITNRGLKDLRKFIIEPNNLYNVGYCYAGFMCRYIYETKGISALKDLYRNGREFGIINWCENQYLMNFEQWEKNWLDWVFLKIKNNGYWSFYYFQY